jgi:hypothetical protein
MTAKIRKHGNGMPRHDKVMRAFALIEQALDANGKRRGKVTRRDAEIARLKHELEIARKRVTHIEAALEAAGRASLSAPTSGEVWVCVNPVGIGNGVEVFTSLAGATPGGMLRTTVGPDLFLLSNGSIIVKRTIRS